VGQTTLTIGGVAAESTRWTIIRGAAAGHPPDRAEFARRYAPVVRPYLGARWRGGALVDAIDDAAQEVFVRCFSPDGPLATADPESSGGFRAYLYGIVRNVARGVEREWKKGAGRDATFDLDAIEARDAPLAEVFDRAWTGARLREAAERQALAAKGDARAERRIELLRLRFQQDLPIREIAKLWKVEAAWVHEEYRTARKEFVAALREVVGEIHPGCPAEVEAECVRLLDHVG